MTTDYALVLMKRYSGLLWEVEGDDYDGIIWHDDAPKPTQADLDAAWPSVREEMGWDRARAERDRLLAESDWTQVADAPVDAAAWAAYRQALRDVPQDFDSPDEVVWPTAP